MTYLANRPPRRNQLLSLTPFIKTLGRGARPARIGGKFVREAARPLACGTCRILAQIDGVSRVLPGMVSPDCRQFGPIPGDSAVEKLPQHVVHGLAFLAGRHRRAGGCRRRRGRFRLRLRGRASRGRGDAAALRAAAARGLTCGLRLLAGRSLRLAKSAQALLQQVADGRAEIAAERVGLSGSGAALLTRLRAALLDAAEQSADRSTKASAVLAEQAFAHLAQLCVGLVRIF